MPGATVRSACETPTRMRGVSRAYERESVLLPGVRGALCLDEGMAKTSRTHNNSNVLCIAQDLTDEETLQKMLNTWLTSTFDGGRHQRRINKLDEEKTTCQD